LRVTLVKNIREAVPHASASLLGYQCAVNRFFPGVIDYDGAMSGNYRCGRTLSTQAARIWVENMAPFVPSAQRAQILDLGCGTGRFSILFAEAFQAHILGIEPSRRMLAAARSGAQAANLAYAVGAAERIPLKDRSRDVAWLSHVWHHVRDRGACVEELRRVLRRGGYVLVRGTFGDRLDGFPTMFHYWPAAQDICRQLPTVAETVLTFTTYGFVVREHRRVRQTTCDSLQEFAGRTKLRADTALALISDAEFQEGQRALEKAASLERVHDPVVETIEMVAFVRREG
jgi:ubiquinone/menaquinone biosynthesis C-methylase UbiE